MFWTRFMAAHMSQWADDFEVVVTRLVTDTLAYVCRVDAPSGRVYALKRILVTDHVGDQAAIREGDRLRVHVQPDDLDRITFAQIVVPVGVDG